MKSVENGVALLDERLPNWRHHVDADQLNLESTCNCVIGQLFGDYYRGLIPLNGAARFGFDMAPRSTYQRLTTAWRKVLA